MQVLEIPDKKYWSNPDVLSPSDLLGGGGVSSGGGAGNTKSKQNPRQLTDIQRPKRDILEPNIDIVLDEIFKSRGSKKAKRLNNLGPLGPILMGKAPQEDQGWEEKYDKDVWSRIIPFGEQIVDRRTNQTHTIPSPFLPALVGNPWTLNNPALKGLPFWARIGLAAGEKFLRALRDLPQLPSPPPQEPPEPPETSKQGEEQKGCIQIIENRGHRRIIDICKEHGIRIHAKV